MENTVRLKEFWLDVIMRHDYSNEEQKKKINTYRKKAFDYFAKYLENYPYKVKTFLDVGCFDDFDINNAENIGLEAMWVDLYPVKESEKIIIHNFYKLEELGKKFDIVFLNHTLEHSDSVYKLMEQISKIQDKNSLLFISVPDWASEWAYSLYQSTTHYSILNYWFLQTTMSRFGYNVIPHRVELREWCPELWFIWIKH